MSKREMQNCVFKIMFRGTEIQNTWTILPIKFTINKVLELDIACTKVNFGITKWDRFWDYKQGK